MFVYEVQSYCCSFFYLIFWPRWVFVAASGFSLAVVSGGYSVVVVQGLLIMVASLGVEHGL